MTSNPYIDDDGTARLVDSFVLYLDVLGSREWARSINDVSLEEMRQVLAGRRWFLHDDQRDNDRQRLVSFTDNVVLGVPHEPFFDDAGLLFVMASCVYYQLNLAARGRFLRGGLTTGGHFMDDQLVAGPALVEAVDLEHEAVYPRVLLSDAVLALALDAASTSQDDPWSYYLLQDEDERVFVNYLPGVADDGIPGWDVEGLLAHRAAVEDALGNDSLADRILAKYIWVAQYHNYVCRRAIAHPRSFSAASDLDLDELEIRLDLVAEAGDRPFRPVPGLSPRQ